MTVLDYLNHLSKLTWVEWVVLGLFAGILQPTKYVSLNPIGSWLRRSPRFHYSLKIICERLRAHGVTSDSRATVLRLGPAPYLSDDQLREAVERLGAVARQS